MHQAGERCLSARTPTALHQPSGPFAGRPLLSAAAFPRPVAPRAPGGTATCAWRRLVWYNLCPFFFKLFVFF